MSSTRRPQETQIIYLRNQFTKNIFFLLFSRVHNAFLRFIKYLRHINTQNALQNTQNQNDFVNIELSFVFSLSLSLSHFRNNKNTKIMNENAFPQV